MPVGKKIAFSVTLLLCAATPAFAIEQGGVSDVITTLALNSSTPTCLGANGYRRSLTIDNTANSTNIGWCETGGGAAQCTPAIGSAGTSTLQQAWAYWPAGSAPQNQFCFIAATGTPSITIREGN